MPSAASFAQREAERLASLTFFLDHQIGRYVVAEALRAASVHVEVHLDHFPGDKPDLEWIPEVGKRDWVLITKDQGIRRNPLERAAYEAALTARSWVTHHRGSALVTHHSLPGLGPITHHRA